jgi:plastocyanin
MVHFTKLVGVLATVTFAAAVPISGRTEHSYEMSSESSYGNSYDSSYGNYSPQESNKQEKSSMYQSEPMKEESKQEYKPQSEASMKEQTAMAEESSTMQEQTTAMQEETTAMEESTTMEQETTTMQEMPTETLKAEETMVQYGSGSWDKSGYNDCVSQCMAKFGGGSPNSYTMGGEKQGETLGSVGDGATHTVIVAPQQGVLRYVPPFVDANVGDTIMFKWGANKHTVTKSSALLPCNKTGDALFASGTHDKDFTFTQVVNDTNPTYFYCATPGHCPKGMFGVINPAKADGNNSAGQIISQSNSSYTTYTAEMTANDAAASSWGANFDMSSMPEWAAEPMMENIMYMRNVIAMNPDVVDESGNVALGSTAAPLMLPNDVNAVASPETSDSSATDSTGASDEAANASGAASTPNAAGTLTSSKMVMGVAVAVATFFLL